MAFGFAKCQSHGLETQLVMGNRFLDIRCRSLGDSFAVHHGEVYQKMMFGDVLNICRGFLHAHPRETILMRISRTKSDADAAEFRRVFERAYLDHNASLFHVSSTIPTLGQVRGKIVLMTGWPYIGGISLGGGTVDTQDDWNKPSFGDKRQAFHNHLVKTVNAGTPKSKIFMNYTSATGSPPFGDTPLKYAQNLNPYALSELYRLYLRGRTVGVIASDYFNLMIGEFQALQDAIIKMNRLPEDLALVSRGPTGWGTPPSRGPVPPPPTRPPWPPTTAPSISPSAAWTTASTSAAETPPDGRASGESPTW
ncbi:phosphatidylinositol-specific phospholipase C [Embleya sp. AB8]|uniref:phosphatidylinositol-specific phospholipase C n=1 Tax=Embleya sp. AB8 TaxID=3156304 RepID=UPI003C78F5CC